MYSIYVYNSMLATKNLMTSIRGAVSFHSYFKYMYNHNSYCINATKMLNKMLLFHMLTQAVSSIF